MNALEFTDVDYTQFLIAAQRTYTRTEAASYAPISPHEAYARLLHDCVSRLPPDNKLWK